MSELLILDLHNLAFDAIKTMNSSRSFQIISERQAENAPLAFSGVFLIFFGGYEGVSYPLPDSVLPTTV
jgi:hypothetical protein